MIERFILLLLVVATPALPQTVSNEKLARCQGSIVLQAQARQNPSREFSLDLREPAGARLIYIGVRHNFDPVDPQYTEMERIWQQLQPTEAFYEGTGNFVGDTRNAAIERSGEPGLVRYLASVNGVPARSLEPPREAEVEFLLQKFTAEQLVLFFVTRSVAEERDRRNLPLRLLEDLFDHYLAQARITRQLSDVLPDMAVFRRAYERWFPGMDPASAPMRWFDPIGMSAETGGRFFNEVSRESTAFRDTYMYRLLAQAWQSSARIFAAVGRDHIPAQAAALRCALTP